MSNRDQLNAGPGAPRLGAPAAGLGDLGVDYAWLQEQLAELSRQLGNVALEEDELEVEVRLQRVQKIGLQHCTTLVYTCNCPHSVGPYTNDVCMCTCAMRLMCLLARSPAPCVRVCAFLLAISMRVVACSGLSHRNWHLHPPHACMHMQMRALHAREGACGPQQPLCSCPSSFPTHRIPLVRGVGGPQRRPAE